MENGVKHGILPREEGGTVRIAARRENGYLFVSIEDDGVGIEDVDGLRLDSDEKSYNFV